jgi:hypothetical protein
VQVIRGKLRKETSSVHTGQTTRVEAGSNTSTVTLRVVGGDERGSLKSETVKYGREFQGTRTRERLRWQGPVACKKDRPVLSSERAPSKNNKTITFNSNKHLVMGPRRGLTPRLVLTDRQSQCDLDLDLRRVELVFGKSRRHFAENSFARVS